jgi:hypothetical protein
LPRNSEQDQLEQTIIQATLESQPQTVQELVNIVKQTAQATDKQIINSIVKLQNQGRLKVTAPPTSITKASAYLKTAQASWYWITLALTIATMGVVFTIPADSYPPAYIRQGLGIIFVLWLPGYSLTRILFPKQVLKSTSDKDLDTTERVALSIGLSLALASVVVLLLNYTFWGITITTTVLSLSALTLVFATAGIIREYQTNKN